MSAINNAFYDKVKTILPNFHNNIPYLQELKTVLNYLDKSEKMQQLALNFEKNQVIEQAKSLRPNNMGKYEATLSSPVNNKPRHRSSSPSSQHLTTVMNLLHIIGKVALGRIESFCWLCSYENLKVIEVRMLFCDSYNLSFLNHSNMLITC